MIRKIGAIGALSAILALCWLGPPLSAATPTAVRDDNGALHTTRGDLTGNTYTTNANSAVTLLASTTDAVAHTVNGTAVSGLGKYKELQVFCSVTAAAAAAGDTLDVYIDTSPNAGTTWFNAIHFTQVLGNGGAKSFQATLAPSASAGTSVTATTADAASGAVRPTMLCDYVRVRYVIVDGGAHGQSFTLNVLAWGRS